MSSELNRHRASVAGALTTALLLAAALTPASPATARTLLTVDEALALAFPGCTVERRTIYPTETELERASELAGERVERRIVHPYRASCDGEAGGSAYFDTHRVRTLPETVMVVVDPDDRVRRVELLTFQEPPDYIPRAEWYEQFESERLGERLRLKRDIHPIAGATLTARATTAAVRRVLALHRVLSDSGGTDGTARSGESGSDRDVPESRRTRRRGERAS